MNGTYVEERVITDKKLQNSVIEKYEFVDCDFRDCNFEDCKIIGCNFVNCRFYNCTVISLRAEYSAIKNTVFEKCNLIGVHWNDLLPGGRYAFPIQKLKDSFLKYNTFIKMNFTKFDFSGNGIQESAFEECRLSESDFRNCRLEGTQIVGCDIRKADFRESRGYLIDVKSNQMKGARFSFPEAMNLLTSLEIIVD